MTKKDYILIAECLRSVAKDNELRMSDDISKREASDAIYSIYMRLAYAFEQENNRFDRNKFYEYIFSELPRYQDFKK